MKKKTNQIISIIIAILICFTFFIPRSYATTLDFNPAPLIDGGVDSNTTGKIATVFAIISNYCMIIGTITAIAIAIVVGVKFMLGSVDDKSDYKKKMIPYVIGATIMFAASGILKAIAITMQKNIPKI